MNTIPAALRLHLLSNGNYHVMLTRAGAGAGRWKNLAVTRWREDATCDDWGSFCYIRDLASGDVWSSTHQPTRRCAGSDEAIFTPGLADLQSSLHGIQTQIKIVVLPHDDVEVCRVRLTSRSSVCGLLAVTSYAEVVLAPAATDAAHRAFSKLFVETEILREQQVILCRRRPRTRDEPGPWLVHLRNPSLPPVAEVSYETDRMRFIGRGRSTADPQALHGDGPLSGCAGAVLDAVAAVRCTISLKPGPTPSFDLIAGVCGSRDACLGLAARTRYPALGDRARACAPVHAREVPSTLKASEADALWFTRLAGCVMYANAALRAAPDILASHHDLGASTEHADEAPRRDLLFDNGTGGFIADGRECVITTGAGWITPLPWVNVLANPSFGALLSESGSATTWIENAQAFRLTPWSNDPVGAPNIEVCCILDEDSGHTWSPTLLPSGGTATYVTRHGFGNNVFEHERGIGSESVVVVAQDAPVKFVQLTLRNASGRARRLSVTGYLQWVLGDEPAKPQMFVNTEIDAARTRTAADGPGDWSDGMNLVGTAGKGDSVRLGFFLCRAMCVACAKTVASTRTLRSGWRWPSRHSATPSVRGKCSRCLPPPATPVRQTA